MSDTSDPDHMCRLTTLDRVGDAMSSSFPVKSNLTFKVRVACQSSSWSAANVKLARKVVTSALSAPTNIQPPSQPLKLFVDVTLADDDYLRELNRAYRGQDRTTNVLAFPLYQPETAVNEDHFGEIVVSYSTLKKEARAYRANFLQYFTRILVHGTLHLLGYRHDQAATSTQMLAEEKLVLASFNCEHLV